MNERDDEMLARILLDAHGFDGWVVCVHSVEKVWAKGNYGSS